MLPSPSTQSSSMAEPPSRPLVFFDIQWGAEFYGRVVVELFVDKAPKTCENFRALCTSSFTPPSASRPLTYKLSLFHRVIDDFMIQGGDITAGDGTGGASIYGEGFEDENIGWRQIDKEGLVCMANRGTGTNSSQFFITLAPCPHLNVKHAVFGHIVSGQETLARMSKVPVDGKDRPLEDLVIACCGELGLNRHSQGHVEVALQSHSLGPKSPQQRRSPHDRGRKPADPSPSRHSLSSQNPHSSSPFHEKATKPTRRRSDFAIDETRRGRSLSRSPSPTAPSQGPHSSHYHPRRRKRSLPPSRSRSRGEAHSPHLRRRRSRSKQRSRSRSPRRKKAGRRERWGDEQALAKEEEERKASRWEDHSVERGNAGYLGDRRNGKSTINSIHNAKFNEGARNALRRSWAGGEGRLAPALEEGGGGEPEVKFKGRGSMKYRERKW